MPKGRISGLSTLGDVRDTIRHHLTPPSRRVSPSSALPFGSEAVQCFMDLTSACDSYLEYGSGASTLAADELRRQFVTVESDRHFLKSVERALSSQSPDWEQDLGILIHADIGPTGTWGKPLFPSIPRPSRWKSYPNAPWATLGDEFRSDLILVDGRFRVACALTVALQQPESTWLLMFDDYSERREYWATEGFLKIKERCGRMAIFEPLPSMDRQAAYLALEHYSRDWR